MHRVLITAAVATAGLTALAATVPAQATGVHHEAAQAAPTGYKVVASGLHNPRQIAFGHGAMYVAEAGQGGTGVCLPNPEGLPTPVCFGYSGSVTRVRHGHQHRVLTGLASIAEQGSGVQAIGPADLVVTGKHSIALTIGLSTAPKNRKKFPKRAQKQLGHLLAFNLHTKKATSIGDIARHEARANPIDNRDSDPTGVAKAGKHGFVVTDSGGNTLVGAKNGKVRSIAAFQDRMSAGTPYQSVPTDVVKGPDGAWYVSELTGAPFFKGAARIWRVVPGHKPHVFAKGLTNVTSIAFEGRKLYAVQLTDNGLLAGPPGSLVRVFPKSSHKAAKVVADGLMFPYGLAIHRGAAYVSVGSVDPAAGQVVKIPLG
jgi:hypothetical protein